MDCARDHFLAAWLQKPDLGAFRYCVSAEFSVNSFFLLSSWVN